MRQTEVSLNAIANSSWILHDVYQTPPAISLIVSLSSGANLTYSVQGTGDDLSSAAARFAGISQAANTITLTDIGPPSRLGTHGLSVGDYVMVLNGPDGSAPGAQGFAYSVAGVTDGTHYTLTSPNARALAGGEVQIITARVFNNPALAGLVAKGQGQWAFPVKASRLVVSAYAAGVVSLTVLQGENK